MSMLKAKQIGLDVMGVSDTFVARFLSGELSHLNNEKFTIIPGMADVHVHFREPGFSYKETVSSGSLSAARGGYTNVCTMPNLNPVPDSVENIQKQLELIEKNGLVNIYPYASITVGQMGERLSDFEGLAPLCIAFSDDGRGVQSEALMLEAMRHAKALGKMIVAHCEDNSLLFGGYIHKGEYAKAHGHKGICSESEWRPIARDIELAAKTGVAYHVCHISCKESVHIIREAKKSGIDITCETGPHYLVLDDGCLKEHGRFKMNPPLRDKSDKEALVEGIIDGTIDMLATDHAPHSAEEKSRGLEKSAFGIVGLETALPLMNTHFLKKGIITPERFIELTVTNPCQRFGIKADGFSVWNLDEEFTVNPDEFLSMGRATPFEGETLSGVNYLTVAKENIVYKK